MNKKTPPDAALLRITLFDLDPSPWRKIEVPLSMTFKGLHDTIQACFLWYNAHLWEFEVNERRYGIPFDDDMFDGEKVYKADNTRLSKLYKDDIGEFFYTYDMGDNWEHHIKVEKFFQSAPKTGLPRFIEGKGNRPPEDIGGPPGFELFIEAINDPIHEEYQQPPNYPLLPSPVIILTLPPEYFPGG